MKGGIKLNYVKEDMAFHDLVFEIGLRPTEMALWDNLFHQWNRNCWAKWFPAKNSDLTAHDKTMTIPTMHNARNRLKQAGLIDFKQQGFNKMTWYKMTILFESGDATYGFENKPGDMKYLKAVLRQSLRQPLRQSLRQPLTNNKQETGNNTVCMSNAPAREKNDVVIPIFKMGGGRR